MPIVLVQNGGGHRARAQFRLKPTQLCFIDDAAWVPPGLEMPDALVKLLRTLGSGFPT